MLRASPRLVLRSRQPASRVHFFAATHPIRLPAMLFPSPGFSYSLRPALFSSVDSRGRAHARLGRGGHARAQCVRARRLRQHQGPGPPSHRPGRRAARHLPRQRYALVGPNFERTRIGRRADTADVDADRPVPVVARPPSPSPHPVPSHPLSQTKRCPRPSATATPSRARSPSKTTACWRTWAAGMRSRTRRATTSRSAAAAPGCSGAPPTSP